MAALSAKQVAAAAYLGGWRGTSTISKAVALAYGESSWNPDAKNPCCHGLWQINTGAHPGMQSNVYDPVQNAKYALQIYNAAGHSFCNSGKPPSGCNPWQAYGNSNYTSKLAEATAATNSLMSDINGGSSNAALGSIGGDATSIAKKILGAASSAIPSIPGAGAVSSAVSGVEGVVSAFNRAGHWITNPDNLMRIFKVISGGVIIFIGVALMLEKPITNALPIGKVMKMAKGASTGQ